MSDKEFMVPEGAQVPASAPVDGDATPTVTPSVAAEVAAENANDNTVDDVPTVADPEHSAPAVEQPVEGQPAAPIDPMQPVGPN